MKLIKFDLPLNGAKVHNLEELRDNFTTEILELHDSGLLLKWLKNRNLMAEAGKLSAIPADLDDADKLVALCEVFGVEADRQVIEAALSKNQASQGVVLRDDTEEFEKPSKSRLNSHGTAHKGRAIAFLVDRHKRLNSTSRFYRLLNKIVRLPVLNLKDRADGFYYEFYIPLEDVDKIPYIYNSIEEAENGCDIDVMGIPFTDLVMTHHEK